MQSWTNREGVTKAKLVFKVLLRPLLQCNDSPLTRAVEKQARVGSADGLWLFGRKVQKPALNSLVPQVEGTERGREEWEYSRATLLDERHESLGKTNGEKQLLFIFQRLSFSLPLTVKIGKMWNYEMFWMVQNIFKTSCSPGIKFSPKMF